MIVIIRNRKVFSSVYLSYRLSVPELPRTCIVSFAVLPKSIPPSLFSCMGLLLKMVDMHCHFILFRAFHESKSRLIRIKQTIQFHMTQRGNDVQIFSARRLTRLVGHLQSTSFYFPCRPRIFRGRFSSTSSLIENIVHGLFISPNAMLFCESYSL
jgi:hypothetical protein